MFVPPKKSETPDSKHNVSVSPRAERTVSIDQYQLRTRGQPAQPRHRGIGSLKRRAVMALGHGVRHAFSSLIARYSEIGDPSVIANGQFPWVKRLEENWDVIRDEADVVLQRKETIPALVEISPDHKGIADKKWKSFFMWGYGYRVEENCARCPRTAALLADIPGLQSAFYSIMEPGARLIPHRGVTKAIFTVHLGLRLPRDRERCWMIVDGQKLIWREGNVLIFDDTYEHYVHNGSDEHRVILLLHVKRPVRFPGSLVADFFLWAVRKSPFVQDALRNLELWNSSPNDRTE